MSTKPENRKTPVPESNLGRKTHPARWTVRRAQWFKNSMVGNPLFYTEYWEVIYGEEVQFYGTYAEALEYADRMARTREYVLPRPDKDGDIATTDEQVAWENTEFERTVVSVAWIEEPGTIGLSAGDSDHYMTTDGAHSIALALLALAEQEENACH